MPPPGQAQRAVSKFIVFEAFEKMNTQSVRQALSEKELAWLENLQPIAGNNLLTVPGPRPTLVTLSETISSQFYANIGTKDYIVSFTTVGSGWTTDLQSLVSVRFAAPGTFSSAPDMTVWQSQYILINDSKAGYASYNATVFVHQGGVSPVLTITNGGSGYTSAPTVTISGGSGSGATAVATIGTPQVNAVNVINGGLQYGPAPTVVFAGGGGAGAAATAIIDPRSLISTIITNQGGYVIQPTSVTLSGGGGSGGVLSPVWVVSGAGVIVLQSLSITSAGSGYTSAPTVVFNGGSIAPGNPAAAAQVTVGNGAVTSITVTNPGGGYTSAPTVSFSGGGSGTGATAAAVVGGGGVLTLTLTNPGGGYLASDVLTVTIVGGGGTAATAIGHVWPFVPAGTTLAVFQGRVWLGGGRLLQWTGTTSFDDFNPANASGSLNISDADLVHQISALRNYNNYLFIMGDQSVKQIGNISLNQTGNVTLFTILTLSSDQGTIYPRSCGSFNRLFMFANTNGIYAVFGSSVQKISDDLDGIFKLIDFSQQPQSALLDMNNIHNITWLVRYKDPLSTTRSLLLTFNGKKWFLVSQGDSLVTAVYASTVNPATFPAGTTRFFGSSGTDITALFSDNTIPVTFKIQSSLTHHGNAVQRKATGKYGFAVTANGTSTINVSIESDEAAQTTALGIAFGFQTYTTANPNISGTYLGMTITGTQAGFTLTNLRLSYLETNTGNKS